MSTHTPNRDVNILDLTPIVRLISISSSECLCISKGIWPLGKFKIYSYYSDSPKNKIRKYQISIQQEKSDRNSYFIHTGGHFSVGF